MSLSQVASASSVSMGLFWKWPTYSMGLFWKWPTSVLCVDKQQGILRAGLACPCKLFQTIPGLILHCQGSVPAVTVAAEIHYTGVWQWCNDPAARSLLGAPTVGLVRNHSSCLVVMQPQPNSVLTFLIVLLLQTRTFCFPSCQQLETSDFATWEASFQKLSFEWNEWQ